MSLPSEGIVAETPITSAPASANPSAMALPMPLLQPVTNAILPSKLIVIIFFQISCKISKVWPLKQTMLSINLCNRFQDFFISPQFPKTQALNGFF
jgi:hypothetical protein